MILYDGSPFSQAMGRRSFRLLQIASKYPQLGRRLPGSFVAARTQIRSLDPSSPLPNYGRLFIQRTVTKPG